VPVGYPTSPDPPFVTISAPDTIGYCDDLILEGNATYPPLGERNRNKCGING